MKKISKYNKKMKAVFMGCAMFTIVVSAFFLPSYTKFEYTGDNIFKVSLNGTYIGTVADAGVFDEHLTTARRILADETQEMFLASSEVSVEGDEILFGKTDEEEMIISNIYQVLKESEIETLKRAYTVKIGTYMVNLADSEQVLTLLNTSIGQYDTKKEYAVDLVLDPERELNVLTTNVVPKEELMAEDDVRLHAGVEDVLSEIVGEVKAVSKDDFDLGLLSIGYAEEIEVVESYLNASELTDIDTAIEEVTQAQEKDAFYPVQTGDTLSEIAIKTGIPMEKIIEINEGLQDENSTIRAGEELVITIPEPELSVERQEQVYYEEDYEAEVQYVDNDDWFITEKETLQEPSAGHRKVVATVSYKNEKETGRDIVYEDITMEAVPKIVERGTKVPPTYIKPIYGGRFTSGYKARWGRMHKGVDWACPIGTTVMASSSGTVTKAGWGSGYGYVVYISHADGRQTRYGHLSKVLVKPGQRVAQGDKIALSGNTGRSTGPHVHFEILINGSQVNALKYLN